MDTLERINTARAALRRDATAAYDKLSPPTQTGPEREGYIHPILMALSDDTRELLERDPRWSSFLSAIARDATIHNDFRVRALALLSRIQAPEPREMVLDFAAHTDFEDLAEIVLAYKDPALIEALLAKAPKRHHAGLEMFLGLPKQKPTKLTPKKSPPKPTPKKKPTPKR